MNSAVLESVEIHSYLGVQIQNLCHCDSISKQTKLVSARNHSCLLFKLPIHFVYISYWSIVQVELPEPARIFYSINQTICKNECLYTLTPFSHIPSDWNSLRMNFLNTVYAFIEDFKDF